MTLKHTQRLTDVYLSNDSCELIYIKTLQKTNRGLSMK